MSTANKNDNALAIANGIVGQIVLPADVQALDALIEKLGDRSAQLSPEEKTAAIDIVNEWDKSVTARVKANAERARTVLSFLDGAACYGTSLEDTIELFHGLLGDTPEYIAYKDAVEAYADVRASAPCAVPVTGGMTIVEAERLRLDNYARSLEHHRVLRAAEHDFSVAVKNYISAINAMDCIKDLRATLTSYKTKANRLAAECSDRASRAKLNISVSNPDAREALRGMLDFAARL